MDFLLNGRTVQTDGFSAHTTLLEYLRASGLTGAKEGCAEGECGACAVALVSPDAAPDGQRSRYRAINSCLVFLPSIAGQEVYTVEGLACAGQLSEPQRAIAEGGGSQCGYCTPGFVVSLFAEYYRPGRSGPCDPLAMAGNLCRCTGYRPLRDAALALGEPPAMGDAAQSMSEPQATADVPRAMGDALRATGQPPALGDAPQAIGDAPQATGQPPATGDAPQPTWQPLGLGDAPQAIGDAPQPTWQPLATGDAPRALGEPRAMESAAPPADAFRERLRHPAPPLTAFSAGVAGARFERPASLADGLALVAAHPEACLVAGATDLAVEANLRGRRWPMLVSVEAVPEMKTFSETADAVEIGAGLTLSEIEERWISAPAAVRDWFALFASPLIRNRATLGGNLATASPVGDSAPLLLALEAELRVAGPRRARSIPVRDFFTGYRQTALRPGELIVFVRIPKPLPSRFVFYKVAKRVMDDISTVAAAFALDVDTAGRITRARAAYGGVAATPVLVAEFRQALLGRTWNQSAVHAAQEAVAAAIAPLSDHRGSAAYRLAVSQSLIEKFWWETREAQAA